MFTLEILSIVCIIILALLSFLIIKLFFIKKPPELPSEFIELKEDQEFIKTAVQSMIAKNELIDEINKKVKDAEEKSQFLAEKINQTRLAIDDFTSMQKSFINTSQSTATAVSQIEKVLIGFKPKETITNSYNIVHEALAIFPKDIVEKDYPVGGHYVEFAIILPNRKIVPVESRFDRQDLVEKMNEAKEENEKKKILEDLKNAIISKISESSIYADSVVTEGFCIVALPDLIYQMSGEFLFDAFKRGVIVISYSNTIPYILTLLKLREKYATTLDMQKLNTSIGYAVNLMYDFGVMVETTMADAVNKLNTTHKESKRYLQELQIALAKIKTERLDYQVDSSISDFDKSFKL